MKKVATIVLLTYYSFGIFCLPMGDFSRIAELPEMYKHCKIEDPDINVFDFVGEHLMNLENIIEHFEHHEDHEKNEQPHQTYHFAASSGESIYTFSPAGFSYIKPAETAKPFYFNRNDNWRLPVHCTDIFHPPAMPVLLT